MFVSRKDKLINRFSKQPNDFHYDELVRLLGYFGYYESKMGKTSGSRVKFKNDTGGYFKTHKPHPSGILKAYQIKQVKEILGI